MGALLAAALAGSSVSHARAATDADQPTATVERLLDGTTLVLVPLAGAERAAVRVVVRAGGDDDPPGRAGLAELTAHAVLQGTYDMQHGALFQLAAKAGGAVEVEVKPDATVFSVDTPSGGVTEVLVPLLKTVTAPALPFVDLEEVRLVAGAVDVEQAPLARAGWAARHVAFPSGHGGLVLLGSAETRRAVLGDDVTSFYQRYYLPARIIVIVIADLGAAEVRALVEQGLHGAPVPSAPSERERRDANVPSEARGRGKRTLAVSAAVLDAVPDGACLAAARLLELRLRRRLAGDEANTETHAGCEPAFGHTMLTLAARSSSPSSSALAELVREVRRDAPLRGPTAAERTQVAARVAELHRSALQSPAGLAALLVEAARRDAALDQGAARALRSPRLDWPGAAKVLKACGDDRRAVEVAFSPFSR